MGNHQLFRSSFSRSKSNLSLPEELHDPAVRLLSVTKSFDGKGSYGSESEDTLSYNKLGKSKTSKNLKKGSKQNVNDLNGQLELSQLAERLRFIEQKIIESERNIDRKFQQMYIQTSTEKAEDDRFARNSSSSFASDNVFENQRLCPSSSADDCTRYYSQGQATNSTKHKDKRKKSILKSATIQNSRSIPSLINSNEIKKSSYEPLKEGKKPMTGHEKFVSTRHSSNLTSSTVLPNSRSSTGSVDVSSVVSNKGWRNHINAIGNYVDERILKGRWNSSKSVRSSSSSGSIRSNSVCSAISATIPASTGSAAGSAVRTSIDGSNLLESNNLDVSNEKTTRRSTHNARPHLSTLSDSWMHWPIQDEQALLELERSANPYFCTGDSLNQNTPTDLCSTPTNNLILTNRLGQPQVNALAEIEAFERLLSQNLAHK